MFWFKKKIDSLTSKHEFNFKKTYSSSQRQNKRKFIDEKYVGDRSRGISYLVVEKSQSSKIPSFKKAYKLFAVDNGMRVIDLIAYIRSNLKMSQKQSIFLTIGNVIANSNHNIGELYQIYREPDGFLYVSVSEYQAF